jgi:quercetin dioxygenase-like cupin family protein/DNA-binding CsgD family transcriptional regulator
MKSTARSRANDGKLHVVPAALLANADDNRPNLRKNRSAAFEGLDAANCGFLVLNAKGSLVFSNHAARTLLDAGDALCEQDGALQAASPAARPILRAAISAALAPQIDTGNPGSIFLLPRQTRLPIIIAAAPIAFSAAGDAKGIILLYDGDAPVRLSISLLRRLFSLTNAEAALCVALYEGSSLRDFAETRKVSLNTARTLLGRAFIKTGKKKQSDLMRLLGALTGMQSLGAGFVAGVTAGLIGFDAYHRSLPNLRLESLLQENLQRFPGFEALVRFGEYAPGGTNKRHSHSDCMEIIYVMQGAISTALDGGEARLTKTGEAICIEADVMHQGRNASEHDPAKFSVVKLKRKSPPASVSF